MPPFVLPSNPALPTSYAMFLPHGFIPVFLGFFVDFNTPAVLNRQPEYIVLCPNYPPQALMFMKSSSASNTCSRPSHTLLPATPITTSRYPTHPALLCDHLRTAHCETGFVERTTIPTSA